MGRNFERPKTKMGDGLEKTSWSGGGGGGTCRPAGRRLGEGGKMVALPTRSWGLGRGWGRAAGSFAVHLNACSSCGASSQGTAFCLWVLGAGSFFLQVSCPLVCPTGTASWAAVSDASCTPHGNLCTVSLEPFSWRSIIEYFSTCTVSQRNPLLVLSGCVLWGHDWVGWGLGHPG